MKHLLFLIILFASCTKEVSKIELRPPARSFDVVDITIRFYPASHQLVRVPVYGLEIKSSHTMRVATNFFIEWKDKNRTNKLSPFILAGQSTMLWETMIEYDKGASDLRLVKVEGDTTIIYRLKQIL